jgi:hypothetical protein
VPGNQVHGSVERMLLFKATELWRYRTEISKAPLDDTKSNLWCVPMANLWCVPIANRTQPGALDRNTLWGLCHVRLLSDKSPTTTGFSLRWPAIRRNFQNHFRCSTIGPGVVGPLNPQKQTGGQRSPFSMPSNRSCLFRGICRNICIRIKFWMNHP